MMRLFRTFLVSVLFVTLSVSVAFSTGDVVKRITAYKQDINSAYLPKQSLSIRCLTPTGEDVVQDSQVFLSEIFRSKGGNDFFPAFSWICSGNIFGNVIVEFKFTPLTLLDSTEEDKNFIFYKVKMEHTESRIGNASISLKKEASTDESLRKVFPSDTRYTAQLFSISYSDNYEVPDPFDVKEDNVEQKVKYDFSKYSKVYRRDRVTNIDEKNPLDSTSIQNDFVKGISSEATSQNICEYWNRYGSVFLALDLTDTDKDSDGNILYKTNGGNTVCSYGLYSATVTVTVALE